MSRLENGEFHEGFEKQFLVDMERMVTHTKPALRMNEYGIVIEDRSGPRKPIAERVADNEVSENWLQFYIANNFKKLGFTALEGPFKAGPDFRVKSNGRWVQAEAEILCTNYISHRHKLNPAFNNVRILIVLEADEPKGPERKELPSKIIHVDRKHFTRWYEKTARAYAEEMEKGDDQRRDAVRVHLLASRYVKGAWLEVCMYKDGESAICPECDLCPYLEYPSQATERFTDIVCSYLNMKRVEELRLDQIDPAELRRFSLNVLTMGTYQEPEKRQ